MAEQCKLRTDIEQFVKDSLRLAPNLGRTTDAQLFYGFYFNYELNTYTWRLIVNKQILMNYHRLLIEM